MSCLSPPQIPKKKINIFVINIILRLVLTSDGVRVISGVVSMMEMESEESERFHFLPTPLTTPSLVFSL